MSRENRIVLEDGIYHVIDRGNRGNKIFISDSDNAYFIKRLKEFSTEYSIDIFSYVLMSNHYHFLLKLNKPNLSQFMQRLNLLYTKYFNYMHGLNGHLFQDRYKAFLIESDNYFVSVLRYIALNPVLAGIVSKPEKYMWGSYKFYFENSAQDWIKTEKALSMVGFSRNDFILFVQNHSVDYGDFLKFESVSRMSKRQIGLIIARVEEKVIPLRKNKKLRDVTVFYLATLGARHSDIARELSLSERNVRRIFGKVRKEIENGNILYKDIYDRVKNVLLVPGTSRTKKEIRHERN